MVSVTDLSRPLPTKGCLDQIKPWVTVICTSYNQQDYIEQALQSVVDQDYPNVELIVLDNGSTDQSAARIRAFIQGYSAIRFIQNSINLGLNRAFNQGLTLATGSYIIDLSADDVLLPSRIGKQVALFEQLSSEYGIVFSNAVYIDANGRETDVQYAVDTSGHARSRVPTGDVFRHILTSCFICTPTMMMRRDVLTELGGYDVSLSYEDFDFWVRSSRLYQYAYLDEILTQKRRLPNAMSAQIVLPNNTLLPSTLVVCQKAFDRCTTPDEFRALAARLRTFIRKAFYTEQIDLARQFGELLVQIEEPGLLTSLILGLSHLRVPVNGIYRRYLRYRPKPV